MHRNPAFSQAVVVEGNARTIYVGGQNAVDAQGRVVGAGDLAAQTERTLENLATVLAAAGARLQDVVKWTVFAVQGQDARPAVGVFQRVWGSAPPPAISVIAVAGLANPEFLVEVEAIAVTGVAAGGDA
jgi:enamine deaminase RidA (YjgF/YER057c/UK114 family)